MATESPSPRRPPPRPPKSQYLLDKEAEALATKLIVSHVSSISYPKGKNPFGESSEDESDLPENKGSLPQQSSASSKLTSSVPPKVSTNPFAECDSDDGEIDGKQSLFDADKAKPSQNFPGPQETPPFNPIAICKLDVKTKIDSEHDGESSNVDQASTVKVSSSNPFDDVTDNEEDEKSIEQGLVSMKEVKEEETPTEGPDEELVPPKPPRKRLAPRPPPYSNFSSDISGNMQTAMRFSLQTMNDSAEMSPSSSRASPAECRRLSTSCESVRVKGPAPSLPVGQKREIRAEGFIKYSRLMREVEEVNKCLVRYDEEVEALKAKVDGAIGDPWKSRRYSKKLLKVKEKRQSLADKHRQLTSRLQEQMLEDQHADLEFELRTILAKQEHLRTPEEQKRADELLQLLLEIVQQRDKLVKERDSTVEYHPYSALPQPVSDHTETNGQPLDVLRSD